jgi:hypothetical protein
MQSNLVMATNNPSNKSLVVGLALAAASVAAALILQRNKEKEKRGSSSIINTSTKEEISFPSADNSVQLHGNLYLSLPPKDTSTATTNIAAIVIVAGSGPID